MTSDPQSRPDRPAGESGAVAASGEDAPTEVRPPAGGTAAAGEARPAEGETRFTETGPGTATGASSVTAAEARPAEGETRVTEAGTGSAAAAGVSTVSGGVVASPGVGTNPDPVVAAAATRDAGPAPAAPSDGGGEGVAGTVEEKPEILVGAAFAGAFVLAKILRAIVR